MDLFAPGTDIWSTASKDDPFYYGEEYAQASGTSLAGPAVAGTAVLMASATGNRLTGAQLKRLLRQTVDVLPALRNKCISGVRTCAAGVAAVQGVNTQASCALPHHLRCCWARPVCADRYTIHRYVGLPYMGLRPVGQQGCHATVLLCRAVSTLARQWRQQSDAPRQWCPQKQQARGPTVSVRHVWVVAYALAAISECKS